MLLSFILSTLLLAGLLFWYGKYLSKVVPVAGTPEPESKKKYWVNIVTIVFVSMGFVGAFYLINIGSQSSKTISTKLTDKKDESFFLSPNEQFEIAKAFYTGKGLPKDNGQALSWLILSAMQGHKESQELVQLLGYEIKQDPQDYSMQSKASFAVDIIPANKIKTKLKDIAGMRQAKEDVQEFIDFIKDPKKYKKLGARPPKGIIMTGPPGVGKTLLARAIAGEANVTFMSVSGSAFEDQYVGTGAARIRELFTLARQNKPVIIFIDEIDSLAPSRKGEGGGSSVVQTQTINQLLSEMDNLDDTKNEGIYMLAATNRLESLDAALLRPGRFDWQFNIRLPDDNDRKAILEQKLAKVPLASDVDIKYLVENTAGYSGADLANLVNEAGIYAGRNNKTSIDKECFDQAFKKIANYEKDPNPGFSVSILSPSEIKTRFSDIAGMNEAKKEVTELVEFLKSPKKYSRLGAKSPGGVLIYGPPGTGKTMMARAIAGESNASFLSVSGAEFDEMWVGVGASRVRELFKLARKYKPCIVFIDEIDALAPKRSGQSISGNDQTINQLLSEMDNIQKDINDGIVILAATNRLDIIDPAILRPGRFDRKVYFRLPSLQEREDILKVLTKKIHFENIDFKILAQITPGYSGADLANLVNEAAIEATRQSKPYVDMASFEEANDKISLGVPQGSSSYTEKEKKLTAYHEAGHALVGLLHPDQPRVFHKMTIGLRDYSLGVTHFRYEAEAYSHTKKEFEAIICTSLGGYIAEELIFGKDNITSGASSDLVNANRIAKDMVTKYAMGDNQSFLVDEIFPNAEDATKSAEKILKRDYDVAKKILQDNMDKLHLLANTLLEKETLDYQQIRELLNLKSKKE